MKSRISFSVGLVVFFAGLLISPAQATVTSSLAAKPDAYTGTCPTDITFNGTIYLNNVGTLQYRFVRSDGSTNPNSGKFTTTFAAGGTNNVSDVWSQVTSNGSDKLEVYYNNTTFLQSQTASFTVVCTPNKFGGATSAGRIKTSTTEHFNQGALSIGLVPPTNLHSTTDPLRCAQHIPPPYDPSVCPFFIQQGFLVLLWDFSNQPCGKTCVQPDGYYLYDSRSNPLNLTQVTSTLDYGSSSTMTVVTTPVGLSGCYAVTAYKGHVESDPSVEFCVPK